MTFNETARINIRFFRCQKKLYMCIERLRDSHATKDRQR